MKPTPTAMSGLAAISVVAIVATALPPQEYGSLTPALQATIAQQMPPYTINWQQARNDAVPADMQQPPNAAGNNAQTAPMPDPETVTH